MKFLLNFIQRAIATVGFIGYLPFMPGTFGSAAMVAALWYADRRYDFSFSGQFWIYYWVVAVVLVMVSIVFSSRSKELYGSPDSSHIVIDECAGQFITFLFVPFSLMTLALGFVLFRLFDVVKPFPVNKTEEIEGGVGVTADDVAAGVMANISLLLIMAAYHFLRGRM